MNLVTFYDERGVMRTKRIRADNFDNLMCKRLKLAKGSNPHPYIINIIFEPIGCH